MPVRGSGVEVGRPTAYEGAGGSWLGVGVNGSPAWGSAVAG